MLPVFGLVIWFALQRVACGSVNCTSATPLLYLNTTADDIAAAKCGGFNIDIFIGPSQTGAVSLDGLNNIGDKTHDAGLHVVNCSQVTSISGNSLQMSGGWLTVENSPLLTKLSFPLLSWIGLGLSLTDVPLLNQLELANGVEVGELDVGETIGSSTIDNTGLSTIDGLFGGTTRDISITNNPRLQTVHLLASQILPQYNASYTGNLVITNNSANITVDLPNLSSIAGSMSLGNVAELSIPSLGLVNGSMELTEASFPSLSAPQLQRINGNLSITGSFSSLSFPNLTYVGGDLFLQSSSHIDCEYFQQLSINGSVKGGGTCNGVPLPTPTANSTASATPTANSTASATPTASSTASTTPTSTQPASSSGGRLSAGAKGGIAVASVAAGLTVVVIIIMAVRNQRKGAGRRHTTAAETVADNEPKSSGSKELPHDEGRDVEG